MNLILNRETFEMPADGWYQLAPFGEFLHAVAGVVQVVDEEACTAMAARFAADAAVANFAGLLVDFDHFSLDGERRTEAAGWIMGLEYRGPRAEGGNLKPEFGKPGDETAKNAKDANRDGKDGPSSFPSGTTARQSPADAGLWAKIRWSDVGEEAVKGGRYRFLSPVWARSDCVDLGTDPANGRDRVRPVRLLNAAVTNDPNLKGLRALSNSAVGGSEGSPVDSCTCNRGVETAKNAKRDFEHPSSPRLRRAGKDAKGAKIGNGHEKAQEAQKGNGESLMKRVIEKLMNHLGLAADASEDVVLEKMAGLPELTAVSDLQNSLKQTEDERDALKVELKGLNDDLVNRHLADFEGVIGEGSKGFWSEQLLTNREAALVALGELKGLAQGKDEPGFVPNTELRRGDSAHAESGGNQGTTRKPLHNRSAARPLVRQGYAGQAVVPGDADSRAAKIRNRAHEISKGESIPFSVAFRRAEKEVSGE
jgi:hypothetical protein